MFSSPASMIKTLGLVSMIVVLNMGKVTSADSDSSEGNRETHLCNGSGEQFCGDAHEVTKCPRVCRPGKCREEKPRSRLEKQYDGIIKAGKYDFVYHWKRGRKICIAHCKEDWRKMKCNEGTTKETFWNLDGEEEEARYCPMIDCARVDKNIEGCHGDHDFVEPTCDMCRQLFPKACAPKPDDNSIRRRKERSNDNNDDDDGDDDDDDDGNEKQDASSDSSDVTAPEPEVQVPISGSRKDLESSNRARESWKLWTTNPQKAQKLADMEAAGTPSQNTWTWTAPSAAGKQNTPPAAASNSAATISQERVSQPASQQAPWKKTNAPPSEKEEAAPWWKWTPKKSGSKETAGQQPNSTKKTKEGAEPSWKQWTPQNNGGQGAGQKSNSA